MYILLHRSDLKISAFFQDFCGNCVVISKMICFNLLKFFSENVAISYSMLMKLYRNFGTNCRKSKKYGMFCHLFLKFREIFETE
jgi:hypothetical protein